MSASTFDLNESLAPVRDALHSAARRDAARLLAAAGDNAVAIENDAQVRADEIQSRARDAGAADAIAALEVERARARRRARGTVLRARMEAYQELRTRTRAAMSTIRDTGGYHVLRAGMVEAATRWLGPDVEITEADGGGITAQLGSRRVDLSLATLAERAADAVAAGLEQP
jgi:vacuolar-type H+-ATPase subunit E/Vma4